MMHNETRGVFIMADGEGHVYIYNQSVHPPEQVCKLKTNSESCIRGLCMSAGGSYLVAGSEDGSLSILELGRVKGERFTKQIAGF